MDRDVSLGSCHESRHVEQVVAVVRDADHFGYVTLLVLHEAGPASRPGRVFKLLPYEVRTWYKPIG